MNRPIKKFDEVLGKCLQSLNTWFTELDEFLKNAFIFLLLVFTALFLLLVLVSKVDESHKLSMCEDYAELNSGHEIEFHDDLGCIIKIDGLWIQTARVNR